MSKDRDISIPDFLNALQREYFLALLRSKIYHSIKDKTYYKKVLGYKKEKIGDIKRKYGLDTIFDDENLYEDVKKTIFGETTPNFFYLNDDDELTKGPEDEINYYLPGSDVKVFDEDKVKVGKITFYNFITKDVGVTLASGEKRAFINTQINRII